MRNKKGILKVVVEYIQDDPIKAARILETMPEEEVLQVIKPLPFQQIVTLFDHLNETTILTVIHRLPKDVFKSVIGHLEAQKALAIFLQLNKEDRQQFLEILDERKKKEIQELLLYPDDSAGRIMETKIIAFHQDIKVKDVVHKIRQLVGRGEALSYIYVVDHHNHLTGVLNMRDMLLADENTVLEQVMRRDIYKVNCFDDREKIANELITHKFFAAPVVDGEDRLLGVVKAERLIGEVKEEAAEDMQRMFGASADERAFSPMIFSIRTRLPWLHFNLLTAFLAASVVAMFEDIIARFTVLAIFLPVVAGQGGNAGAQSLAVVMRGLVMREIPPHKATRLIFKETTVGFINGIVIGLVTAIIAWLWKGNPFLGVIVGLAMIVNLTVAGLAGAIIPISMKALGFDPAQCSSIILTTVTDVMGFFSFLGFAVLMQRYL